MRTLTTLFRRGGALLAAALLSACTTLAPSPQRPAAAVPASWPQAVAGGAEAPSPIVDQAWREVYLDSRLRTVIEQALANNRDLRVAAINVATAQARYRIERADRLPAFDADASATTRRLPADLSGSGEAAISRQYGASVGITAWELDLFGRIRSLETQALQTYFATEAAQRSTQVGLVAAVADAWLALAADRSLLALAERTLDTQQQTLAITRRSFELGASSRLAVSQIETTVARARADVASQTALVAKDRNALALLVGEAVDEAWLPSGLDDAGGALLAEVPAGLSSEVLARRPDVMQAEHELFAANANIGAARAAFFPRISLTAAAGTASASLDSLFEAGQRSWSFAPAISLPIFDAGALAAGLDVAELQRDSAVASYDKAIQVAFREVADALADRATIGTRLAAGERLVAAAQDGYRLSEARTRNGVDSHLSLLDAQRTLYGAEQELIATRLAEAGSRVALVKALGGGWQ
ncbi:MAG: efflux transporter outer membrane subunit [Rhodocyclaceae bacterium]|nr:efflux transporter outer membrane subunit [Rhodocyclaceae bacterium]